MKHFLWFWLPPLGYMAAIFFVSALPNPQIGGETPDYILHALEYFLLALLLIRLFLAQGATTENGQDFARWHQACLYGLLVAVCYGIGDELHQYFIPGRHCAWSDVFADTVGALLAYASGVLDYRLLTSHPAWLAWGRARAFFPLSYASCRFRQTFGREDISQPLLD